jgi:hypothetical protein
MFIGEGLGVRGQGAGSRERLGHFTGFGGDFRGISGSLYGISGWFGAGWQELEGNK